MNDNFKDLDIEIDSLFDDARWLTDSEIDEALVEIARECGVTFDKASDELNSRFLYADECDSEASAERQQLGFSGL
tara:strand:- start:62 stop:289 length:228 start_codon:yes stop_codon:yes gene_type:complete